MVQAIQDILDTETDETACLSVISSILCVFIPDINWAGFYILRGGELVVGPFQGEPPCLRIPIGKGVCGTAAQTHTVQRVADVHQYPGHIACDSKTNSEIVLPIVSGGKLYGVLDIDSPLPNNFTPLEQEYLEQVADLLSEKSEKWAGR